MKDRDNLGPVLIIIIRLAILAGFAAIFYFTGVF